MSRFKITANRKGSSDDFVEIIVSVIILIFFVLLSFGFTINMVNSKVASAKAGLERMEGDYLLVEYLKGPINASTVKAKTVSGLIEESYLKKDYGLLKIKTEEFFDNSFLKSGTREWVVEISKMPKENVLERMGCINSRCSGWSRTRDKRIISEQILPLPQEKEFASLKVTLFALTKKAD
ncbi:hypothetical protein JXA85_07435 [Candidatus Woesearchaeota archaeon]|nr:hypothetical protein [Candidatus Woesearchaeota archaeon]